MFKSLVKVGMISMLLVGSANAEMKVSQSDDFEFIRDNTDKFGIYKFKKSGLTYIGGIKNDKFDGIGVKLYDNGIIQILHYKNDKSISNLPTISIVQGNIVVKSSEGDGKGVAYYKNGNSYIGGLNKFGAKHGEGTFRLSNGKTRVATYNNNKRISNNAKAEISAKENSLSNKYIKQFKETRKATGTDSGGTFTITINKVSNGLYRIISNESGGQKQVMPINEKAKIKIEKEDKKGIVRVRFGYHKNKYWTNNIYYNGHKLLSTDSTRHLFKTNDEAEMFVEFLKYLRNNYK